MSFFNDIKRKFNFRCIECRAIFSIEFEDEKDIEEVQEGILSFECQCGSKSELLGN